MELGVHLAEIVSSDIPHSGAAGAANFSIAINAR